MKIVLDTSVLVAASRSRNGASYRLVSMLPTPRFQIALTIAVYTEWQAVLTRPEHLPPGVTVDAALGFLRYLASVAHLQDVHFLWRPFLRDPDDDMILECAVASRCEFIVTHNVRDFRRVEELKVQAITPADFLIFLSTPRPTTYVVRPPRGCRKVAEPHFLESTPRPTTYVVRPPRGEKHLGRPGVCFS